MRFFSIVIATTFGRSETLRRCLVSIFANNYPRESFEVIVIDSGIDDRGLKVIENFTEEHSNLRFYSPGWGNVGPAKARNLGIKKARGEIVAFTDDDCLVPENWLQLLNRGYESYPEVAGVGGYLEAPAEVLARNIFAQYEKFHEWSQYDIRNHEFVSTKRTQAPFETNNISYRRELLEKVDGFDEDYSIVGSGEDGDLKERILQLGFPILFVPVKVIHLQDYTLQRFLRQQLSRGGGILVYKLKSGLRIESQLELWLKFFLSPLVLLLFLIADRFRVSCALLDTLAFATRQFGKIKYYKLVISKYDRILR